jgi:O-methyltransferase
MIQELLSNYPLISDQVDRRELAVVLEQLQRSLDIEGDVIELGCYLGTSSLFIRRVLDKNGSKKAFHVYDSFEGLPEKDAKDQSAAGDQFVAGELLATKKQMIEQFRKAHLAVPIIHKGWFEDLTLQDIPDKIAFAFLDGDYYSSIRTSLKLIESRMSPGGTIVVDDYRNEALPGAAKAVDEWASRMGKSVRCEASLAIIRL